MERTSEVNEPGTRPGSAETASIKDGMETPPPSTSNRSTSPISCAICLGACVNTSFTETCLHRFCFTCLVTWSKVKAECPLCKQLFRSIIHNVQSDNQYDVYNVQSRPESIELLPLGNPFIRSPSEQYQLPMLDNTFSLAVEQRFRYRTTLTLGRRESLALQHLLSMPPAPGRWRGTTRGESQIQFRRTVYRLNLWPQPLPDFTGRFRECTPEFYRNNPAQVHRLVPWLTRELSVLLDDQPQHINYVLARILELLPEHTIRSDEFRYQMENYLRERTDHFIHELYNFASSPFDLTGYDGAVHYVRESQVPTIVNEIISSSDDGDSDVQIVSTTRNARADSGSTNQPSTTGLGSEIVIETIDHSDSDDSASEVVMVGYVKPPQDRTPEIVDLLQSDSDVVLEDDAPRPSTSGYNAPLEMPLNSNLVKLSLTKRQTNKPRHKKRKRMRLSGSPTASNDSWNASVSTGSVSEWSIEYDSSSDSSQSYYERKPKKGLKRRKLTSDTDDSDESEVPKQRKKRRKKQRKERKHSTAEKVRKSHSKSSSRRKHKKNKRERKVKKELTSDTSSESETNDSLFENTKNFRKTRRRLSDRSRSELELREDCYQPGPSWDVQKKRRAVQSGSQAEANGQCSNDKESARIRSVVKIVNSQESGSETERYTPPNTPPPQTNYNSENASDANETSNASSMVSNNGE